MGLSPGCGTKIPCAGPLCGVMGKKRVRSKGGGQRFFLRCRSISLTNTGEILLNQMLANPNGIQKHIRRVTYHNQGGLISGRLACLNIRKPINVIHPINKMKRKKIHMIISTDAFKALEKIQYPFMIKTLRRIEISYI